MPLSLSPVSIPQALQLHNSSSRSLKLFPSSSSSPSFLPPFPSLSPSSPLPPFSPATYIIHPQFALHLLPLPPQKLQGKTL